MAEVAITRPGHGETLSIGSSVRMRILEDGATTDHRLGVAEGTLAPHTFANPGDEPAHMLSIFTPSGYTHYFRELATTPPDRLEALMARYDTVVGDTPTP